MRDLAPRTTGPTDHEEPCRSYGAAGPRAGRVAINMALLTELLAATPTIPARREIRAYEHALLFLLLASKTPHKPVRL